MDDLVKLYKEVAESLQRATIETPNRIKKLNEVISRAESEIQDLLHLVELENFNAAEGYALASQIRRARIKRRKAKDEVYLLLSIKAAIGQNLKFEPHIKAINHTIEKTARIKANRTYAVRIRTDLSDRFKQIEAKNSKEVNE